MDRRQPGFRPFLPALLLVLGLPGGLAVAADPFFAHEQPRYRSGAELLDDCDAADAMAQARCAGYVGQRRYSRSGPNRAPSYPVKQRGLHGKQMKG